MTLLFQSDRFIEHETGAGHPECPARFRAVRDHVPYQQLATLCQKTVISPLTLSHLLMVHDPDVGEYVQAACKQGGGRIEADTVVSPPSFEVGMMAAGACCQAVEAVLKGTDQNAFCLVRPPGHHATPSLSMGFCLFNNIALAARHALNSGANRVMIVDWDVHHGNGTQDAFYDDEQVTFVSLHRSPFYPGTGLANETGTGKGLGTTFNVPLRFGISKADYHAALESVLEKALTQHKPDVILISAGFDAHAEDPIGSLGLDISDFIRMTTLLKQAAQTHCQGRLVSCMEGGYNLKRLPECVTAHLQVLMDSNSTQIT